MQHKSQSYNSCIFYWIHNSFKMPLNVKNCQVPKDHEHQLLSRLHWDRPDQRFCHKIWQDTSADGHAHCRNGISMKMRSLLNDRLSVNPFPRAQGAQCTWWQEISPLCQTSPVDGTLAQTLCAAHFTSRSFKIIVSKATLVFKLKHQVQKPWNTCLWRGVSLNLNQRILCRRDPQKLAQECLEKQLVPFLGFG